MSIWQIALKLTLACLIAYFVYNETGFMTAFIIWLLIVITDAQSYFLGEMIKTQKDVMDTVIKSIK